MQGLLASCMQLFRNEGESIKLFFVGCSSFLMAAVVFYFYCKCNNNNNNYYYYNNK